jgi:beta-phosphoglucomutase
MKPTINLNKLRGVFFDMDGVLVDSMNYHLQSWKELLEKFNIMVTDEFIFEHEGAMSTNIIKDLFKENGYPLNDWQIQDIYLSQNCSFQEKYLSRVSLFPDSVPLLRKLKSKGLLLGLVTSSRRNLVQKIWKEDDLALFTTIVSADDSARSKPHPDPYLKALTQIQQEAKDCLVIENAPAGIEAANSAGITCFAVASTLPEEKLSRAQQVFPSLNSLRFFLNTQLF